MGNDSGERLAIRELVENWAVWRDAGDWDRFRGVWHDDGTRFFPHDREGFMARCVEALQRARRPYAVLGGTWEERFRKAVTLTDELLRKEVQVFGRVDRIDGRLPRGAVVGNFFRSIAARRVVEGGVPRRSGCVTATTRPEAIRVNVAAGCSARRARKRMPCRRPLIPRPPKRN